MIPRVHWPEPVQRTPPTRRPTCGTFRGYYVHHREHEDACEDCKAAVREYHAARRAKLPPDVHQERRERKNARKRAMRRLRKKKRRDFQHLLFAERRALRKKAGTDPDERTLARIEARAQERAMTRLPRLHPDIFQTYLADELAAGRPA